MRQRNTYQLSPDYSQSLISSIPSSHLTSSASWCQIVLLLQITRKPHTSLLVPFRVRRYLVTLRHHTTLSRHPCNWSRSCPALLFLHLDHLSPSYLRQHLKYRPNPHKGLFPTSKYLIFSHKKQSMTRKLAYTLSPNPYPHSILSLSSPWNLVLSLPLKYSLQPMWFSPHHRLLSP